MNQIYQGISPYQAQQNGVEAARRNSPRSANPFLKSPRLGPVWDQGWVNEKTKWAIELPLTQNKVALIDEEDFKRVFKFKWSAEKRKRTWYAIRKIVVGGKVKTQYLHQFLCPGNPLTDHEDGDGLNNQRWNLRPANRSQNGANSKKRLGCSSKFKGVTWYARDQNWKSQISLGGKNQHLGYFDLEKDAAVAYDIAAKARFGKFAKLNFKFSEHEENVLVEQPQCFNASSGK